MSRCSQGRKRQQTDDTIQGCSSVGARWEVRECRCRQEVILWSESLGFGVLCWLVMESVGE